MWIKSKHANSLVFKVGNMIQYRLINRDADFTRNDWLYYYVDVTPTADGNAPINLTFDEDVEDMWIDDISLYELDGNDNPIGSNLVVDGGFENDTASLTTGNVSGVTVVNDQIFQALICG